MIPFLNNNFTKEVLDELALYFEKIQVPKDQIIISNFVDDYYENDDYNFLYIL